MKESKKQVTPLRALVVILLCLAALFAESRNTISFTTSGVVPTVKAPTNDNKSPPLQLHPLHPLPQIPCQISEITSIENTTSRFRTSPFHTWTCRHEVGSDNSSSSSLPYWLVFVDFEIQECPPRYASSTFQLEGSTVRSRIMGHISDRYIFRDGCGIYNASVAIMDDNTNKSQEHTVNVTLSWTSAFRKYSNRQKDIDQANTIKAERLATGQIEAMFTPERLEYLQRYLEPLFQRQVRITTTSTSAITRASTNGSSAQSLAQPNQPSTTTTIKPVLPDCGSLPMEWWEPAGVFDDPTYNDTSRFADPNAPKQWPFRAARCHFPARTLSQMNHLLAGIRILAPGDSHGDNVANEVRDILCPEINNHTSHAAFFDQKYDCPHRNNTFVHAYRYFLGVWDNDMMHDRDGISANLRHGTLKSCQRFLGLGLYNVTIINFPHWLMVYETQEGLDDFVLALKSLMIQCRHSKDYKELFENHIVLLQSPTARDYLPVVRESELDIHPAHSWRGIHNHRMDAVTHQLKTKLRGHVDGIIPAFDMTLARMKTDATRDGVHLATDAYRQLLHVQIAAVQSAMKYKRGMELPIMEVDDPKARWFVNQPLEWPP